MEKGIARNVPKGSLRTWGGGGGGVPLENRSHEIVGEGKRKA